MEINHLSEENSFERIKFPNPSLKDDLLEKVHQIITKEGGFEKIYLERRFEEIKKNESLILPNNDTLFNYYRENLLKTDLLKRTNQKKSFINFDPRCLIQPLVIDASEVDYDSDLFKSSTVVVISDCIKKWGLNMDLISDENLIKNYGNTEVKIVKQNPLGNSMKINSKEMKQDASIRKKLTQYMEYRESLKNVDICSPNLPETTEFCVNVSIETWNDVMKDLENKIPKQILFKSEYDSMSFLRQEIEGITIPQIYLKVAGCWTGGHEENSRIRAVNINTGSGNVEWYCVDAKNVPKFRKINLAQRKVNIHEAEGFFYTDLYYCLSENIPVIKLIQRPGETVVLKSGTLHWVRSHQNTSNIAWNLSLFEIDAFEQIWERYEINHQLKLANIIPIKTHFLDVFNCASNLLDEKCQMLNKKLFKRKITRVSKRRSAFIRNA